MMAKEITDNEMRVLTALKRNSSKHRPLTRNQLVAITGLGDRTIRLAKESLIKNHNKRIETATTGGYYIPTAGDMSSSGHRLLRQPLSALKSAMKLLKLSKKEAEKIIQKEFFTE